MKNILADSRWNVGRFETNDDELTCGDRIEILMRPNVWRPARVEFEYHDYLAGIHGAGIYYAVFTDGGKGVLTLRPGLQVKRIER
jgi:hypothetical protein